MSKDQVDEIRGRSKSKDNGPWVTDYDAMAMKTTVRQLFKWMPKSTDLAVALSADESVRVDLAPDAIERVDHPDIIDVPPVEPLEPTSDVPAGVNPATGEVAE